MRAKPKNLHLWARALLVVLLVAFCAPYTMFDEAAEYLADTESELVHYYLTPLPDNGEACVDIPAMIPPMRESIAPVFHKPARRFTLSRFFFHPPK